MVVVISNTEWGLLKLYHLQKQMTEQLKKMKWSIFDIK